MTDFLVSGGIVPVSYVLFYFAVLYPSLYILAYWIIIPYALVFYWLSGVLARKLAARSIAGRRNAMAALLVVLGAVSLSPVYVPLRHGQGELQNIVSLFAAEWRSAKASYRTTR